MSILVINDMEQLLEHLGFCVWLFVFSFWCQKGAQISLSSLPFHRSEEESGGAERGGIHQTPDGEAKVSHCTCFQILQASDVASNVISRRLNMQLQPVSVWFLSPLNLFPGYMTPSSFCRCPLRTRALTVESSLIQILFLLLPEQIP